MSEVGACRRNPGLPWILSPRPILKEEAERKQTARATNCHSEHRRLFPSEETKSPDLIDFWSAALSGVGEIEAAKTSKINKRIGILCKPAQYHYAGKSFAKPAAPF